jgi:DNA-directed RNA polymerase subunit alpha
MHIIHNTIGIPKITQEEIGTNEMKFVVQPLPSGYGVTIGNSLRRILLSSIPGARVTGIKVKGVQHEYSSLSGVKDTIVDIMLNLKGLVIDKDESEPEWIHLSTKKAGVVTAADIVCPSSVRILNPDLYITEIDRA